MLQANFNLDSNPDGQDLERIAQITGLSKRVTQVWFQNSRARQKKYFNNQAKKGTWSLRTIASAAHSLLSWWAQNPAKLPMVPAILFGVIVDILAHKR